MMIRTLAVLSLALSLTLPAAAASTASCHVREPGAHWSFGFSIGGELTQDERDRFNLMELRQRGVDATRAEMWGGCIRAFVRKPGGGEEMQLFHPDTFAPVY